MLDLFPDGFEEIERADGIELVAYTDPGGEERLWQAFGGVSSAADVAGGWEERWRDFHRPVRVGPLWIGQSWQERPDDAIAVVIDPGRAFGTGAHPTTRLCLELLAGIEPASLLDVGCGSGVLAIAAAKLGFAPVVAVDVDERAIESADVNAAANGVDIEVRIVDSDEDVLPEADVVVANITREAVESIAPRVRAATLVTSGYLVSQPAELAGFVHVDRRAAEGWAADLHMRARH